MKIPILPKDTRLLVMCSSKRRPEKLLTMIDSFYANRSPGTELVVYVSEDDPRLEGYKSVLQNVNYVIGPNRNMVQVLNYLSCEVFPDMKYYEEINDDHIIRTPNWDEKLIEAAEKAGGWSWVYGWTQNIPTAVFVTGNIVRTLGFFLPPLFVHNYVDSVVKAYGEIGLLVHVPEVVIEHMHACFGKAAPDENFHWVMGEETAGRIIFDVWIRDQKYLDFKKILDAKEKELQR